MNASNSWLWRTRSLITRTLARPVRRAAERRYRAAILKVDRLGDFVLAVSAIRLALQHYGEAHCLLVISPTAEALAAIEFPDTPRLVLPPAVGHKRLLWDGLKARAALAAITVEEAVCFRHQRWDWDELQLVWLGAARNHVLQDPARDTYFADRNTFLASNIPRRTFIERAVDRGIASGHPPALSNELRRHQQVLAGLLGRPVDDSEVLPRFDRLRPEQGRGGIVVAPFGSAAIRDFPAEALHTAIRQARADCTLPLRLCGDRAQQPRLLELREQWRAEGISEVDCAPPMSTPDFARAIAAARLVLTVETATAHLAAAFDRPAVIVIGGGHYGEFGPWGRSSRQHWLTHPIDCVGCNWHCVHPQPYCLTRVTPIEVAEAVSRALRQSGAP